MKGEVFNNGVPAGVLEKMPGGKYVFTYHPAYLAESDSPPVSLTLPKRSEPYMADHLFPFFCGLLSEGVNKDIQCRLMKIDEEDDFTRLLLTATDDTIGSVTIKKLKE